MEKFKTSKLRYICLALACAVLMVCGVLFGTLNSGTASASMTVNDNNSVSVAELFTDSSNKFNATNLSSLYTKIGGSSATNITNLKNVINGKSGKVITSADMRTTNSNKDVMVTFGGKLWTVTYASLSRSGDVIATLWYAGETTNSTFSDGWLSLYYMTEFPYYSNQYGSSYIRSVSLNAGSPYYSAPAYSSAGYISDPTQVTVKNPGQVTTSPWARFTMTQTALGTASKSLVPYLATPSELAWQETESNVALWGGYNFQSEAYGTPSKENWYNGVTGDPAYHRDMTEASKRAYYNDWANDYVWLPSLTETGYTSGNNYYQGLWNTSTVQRSNSASNTYTWLRSGRYYDLNTAYLLSSSGAIGGLDVRSSYAVRPALHLNLSSAALSAAGSASSASKVTRIPTIEKTNVATYTGSLITFVVGNFDSDAVNMPAAANITKPTGATTPDVRNQNVGVITSGTYTIPITLKSGFVWMDGTTGTKNLTITVNKATIALDWTIDRRFDFDGTKHSPTASGHLLNGSAVGLSYTYTYKAVGSTAALAANDTAVSGGYAGTYEVTAGFTTASDGTNYVLSNTKVQYTIVPKSVDVKWTGATAYTYSGSAQAPVPAASNGLATPADIACTLTYTPYNDDGTLDTDNASTTKPKNAGKYQISVKATSTTDQNNYELHGTTRDFEIAQKTVVLKGLAAGDKYYDGTKNVVWSGTATLDGVVTGDTVTLKNSGKDEFDSAEVGLRTVTVTGYSLDGADKDNYVLSDASIVLYANILKTPIYVDGIAVKDGKKTYDGTTKATLVYDGLELAPSTALIKDVGYDTINVSSQFGTEKAGLDITLTGRFTKAAAGTGITVTIDDIVLSNSGTDDFAKHYELRFDLSTADTVTADIEAAKLTVTLNLSDFTYGDGVQLTYSVAGVISNETVAVTIKYKGRGTTTYAESTAAPTAAGDYTVTATIADTNYTLAATTKDYTISKKALTITAEDKTVTYGEAAPAYTVVYEGFVNGDTQSTSGVFTSGTLTYKAENASGTAYAQGGDAGAYTITPSGLVSDNYTITFASGTLTVNKKDVVIQINNISHTYSGKLDVELDPDAAGYTASAVWALADGTSLYGTDTLKVKVAGPSSANVGTTILKAGATLAADNPNYNVMCLSGVYEITKAKLTVRAEDKSITYGQAASACSPSVVYGKKDGSEGFVNNETASAVTAGNTYRYTYTQYGDIYEADGTTVIKYYIIPYGWTAANYEISYEEGVLTVNPKAVTVEINHVTATYGDALKNLSYTLKSGSTVENGDDLGITLKVVKSDGTDVTLPLAVDNYKIVGTSNNANYKVTFEGASRPAQDYGDYAVSPATLKVIAGDNTIKYGSAAADNGYTVEGFVNGDDDTVIVSTSGVTYTYSYDTSDAGKRGVGVYDIIPDVSGLSAANYKIEAVNGKLTVEKLEIQLDVVNQTQVYDGKVPTNGWFGDSTKTYWQVANGFALASWDSVNDIKVTLTRGRATETSVGLYVITGVATANANYDITVNNGTYIINPYEITVYWTLAFDSTLDEKNYTAPTFSFEYDGNPHIAIAQYRDVNGSWAQLSTSGERTNAGTTYQAEAYLPNTTNYAFASGTSSQCKFTIEKRELTVAWMDKAGGTASSDLTSGNPFKYDYATGTDYAPYAYLTNVATGDTLKDGTDYYVEGKKSTQGTWTATLIIINPNYKIDGSVETCVFKIEKAAPLGFGWYESASVVPSTSNKLTAAVQYVYNGNAQHPVVMSGNNNSDKYVYTYYVKTNGSWVLLGSEPVNAGEYKVEATPVDNNYVLDITALYTGGSAEFVIKPATITVEWNWNGNANDGYYFEYNGAEQKPYAQFEVSVNNYLGLAVAVYSDANCTTAATSKDAGTYYAKASLANNGNYVFGEENGSYVYELVQEYKINTKTIEITWDFDSSAWTEASGNVTATYNGVDHAADSSISKTASTTVIADTDGIKVVYKVYRVEGSQKTLVTSIKDAGTYLLAVEFDGNGAAYSNYSLKNAEKEIVIEKVSLEITPSNMNVNYGEPLSGYQVTESSFNGLLASEEDDIIAALTNKASDGTLTANGWLYSTYTSSTAPGSIEIGLTASASALATLNNILKNYDYTVIKATLIINAASGDIKLIGETISNGNFVYDGTAHLPSASYKIMNGTLEEWIALDVILVQDPEVNPNLTDGEAVNAGKYTVEFKRKDNDTHTGITLNQTSLDFYIVKREITVAISDAEFVYGEVTSQNYKNKLIYDVASTGLKPVAGDDLKISVDVNFTSADFDLGGYVIANYSTKDDAYITAEYRIVGSWDSATYGNNYDVIFVGTKAGSDGTDSEGAFTVKTATITIAKRGSEFYDEEGVIENYNSFFINLASTDSDGKYLFINYDGYLGADVTVIYSTPYPLAEESIRNPEPNTSIVPPISAAGEWVVNYKISIPNHDDIVGKWYVNILDRDLYIIVIFQKDFEISYGDDLPENLAQTLIDGGYVTINGAMQASDFRNVATAYAFDGSATNVTNRTNVGKYSIYFELNDAVSSNNQIIYKTTNADEDSNIGRYIINKRQLTVDWGETSFTADGNVHMPEPVLCGLIDEDFTLTDIQADSTKNYTEFTDGGKAVRLSVTAEGDFTSVGGHQLTVVVDNNNYQITGNAAKAISIVGETIVDGINLPDWAWYAIGGAGVVALMVIVGLIIAIRKRKAVEDVDGFNDIVDVE